MAVNGGERVTGAAGGLRLAGGDSQAPGGEGSNAGADADADVRAGGESLAFDGGQPLARRFAAGEPGAFEEVVALYQSRVERLAHRLLGWRGGDVHDAVQDVFLAALQNARRLRGHHGLWPWLATITVNACRTQRRQHWTRLRFLRGRRDSAAGRGGRADDAAAAAARAQARPEAGGDDDETLGRVRDAIARLPRADREVVVLHHLEGLHPGDIAAVLGTSKGAVEVRLSRARARLKVMLADLSEA